jgi:hypothetical protein
MSALDAHDDIQQHGAWALLRAAQRFKALRDELLADCPPETRDALIECMDDAQHAFLSDWEAQVNKALSDAEPTAVRDPNREHRTYTTSNGMRAA